jgi:peptide/nickel transport system substrate-binding protein
MLDPGLNQSLRTNGDAAWFGWPADDKLEALRSQWMWVKTLATWS